MDPISLIPAGSLVVDYSWSRPNPGELAALGVKAACRYLARNSAKVIDEVERDALHAAGIGILLNWEQSEADPLDPSKGARHGASADSMAAALGYPLSLPLIVSVDIDTQPAQWPTVEAYFRAFVAVCRWRLGCYAEAGVANRLVAAGLASFVWGPSATGWNSGVAYAVCDVVQHYGHDAWPQLAHFGREVDSNTALNPLRVWLPSLDAAQTATLEVDAAMSRYAVSDVPSPTAPNRTVACEIDPTAKTLRAIDGLIRLDDGPSLEMHDLSFSRADLVHVEYVAGQFVVLAADGGQFRYRPAP